MDRTVFQIVKVSRVIFVALLLSFMFLNLLEKTRLGCIMGNVVLSVSGVGPIKWSKYVIAQLWKCKAAHSHHFSGDKDGLLSHIQASCFFFHENNQNMSFFFFFTKVRFKGFHKILQQYLNKSYKGNLNEKFNFNSYSCSFVSLACKNSCLRCGDSFILKW